jgi:outer membrane protein OmpA-like peptidoglycan-associated protein
MKTPIRMTRAVIATAVASVFLAACSTTPTQPEGSINARSKLAQLQSDPQLATRAPVAIKEAEIAVRAAEEPQSDKIQGEHLVYIADRKVEIASALAQSRLLVDQRTSLSEQRERVRLDARTREVDSARKAAEFARMDTIDAKQKVGELQRQIAELNAKATERGLVVTLGDVLFDTNKAELKSDAANNLAKLSAFLTQYKDRKVLIEGHTDSIGTDGYNLVLSQHRSDSVMAWLVSQGIDPARITASGKGEGFPVASNDNASGRQLNRRVEVIIANTGNASQ